MKKLVFGLSLLLMAIESLGQINDWSAVEKIFGKRGNVQEGVFKITFPRTDLKVKVGDFNVAPGLALTSWVGLIRTGNNKMNMENESMMMGDLVLSENEVATVISKIVSVNLEVTAVHNHLIGELPTIKYVHFSGKGDAVKLAEAIKSVISVTGTPLTASQAQKIPEIPDWEKVKAILGNSGKENGNLLQYSFPRFEKLTESGMEMPPYMGMATAINFQMEGNKAAITGDFVLLADEVNPVVKELTAYGIAVTAIHNHMLYDNPRLFMLHFWAVDDPGKLAAGLKAALDKTNVKM